MPQQDFLEWQQQTQEAPPTGIYYSLIIVTAVASVKVVVDGWNTASRCIPKRLMVSDIQMPAGSLYVRAWLGVFIDGMAYVSSYSIADIPHS